LIDAPDSRRQAFMTARWQFDCRMLETQRELLVSGAQHGLASFAGSLRQVAPSTASGSGQFSKVPAEWGLPDCYDRLLQA
jgi:hypothetical protein